MYQLQQFLMPEEDGMVSGDLTPEHLIALGGILPTVSPQILIGSESDSAFSAAATGFLAGAAAAAGGSVTTLSHVSLPALSAASLVSHAPLLLHIADHRLRIFAHGMLPLTAKQQTLLLSPPQPVWNAPPLYGNIVNGNGLQTLCAPQLQKRLPQHIPVSVEISTASAALHSLMQPLLRQGRGNLMTLQFSADGRRLAVYTEECGWIFHEKLLMLMCLERLAAGEDAALPYWMPRAAEQMANAYQRRILRYASCSDGSDADARAMAVRQGFSLDGTILCADFLRAYAEKQISLREWLGMLPACHTVKRIVRIGSGRDAGKGDMLRELREKYAAFETAEGFFASSGKGNALVRPSRSGKTATLLTEADNMEAAAELAGDITALLEQHIFP